MSDTSPVAGLLHTVAGLAATCDGLLRPRLPAGTRSVHIVDSGLLDVARRTGVTDEVRVGVAAHVRHLERAGADAVLVTCSSIGEAADDAARGAGIPVLRIDAPMAAEAVRIASTAHGRIAVLATLASALGPTERLVARAAGPAGGDLQLTGTIVPGAGDAADAGARDQVEALVAAAIRTAAREADVIVLAQASMAAAADRAEVVIPVLSSPAGGVRALVTTLTGARPS
jgi:aspartate/glutamate racemase